jgi:hypothetical protein
VPAPNTTPTPSSQTVQALSSKHSAAIPVPNGLIRRARFTPPAAQGPCPPRELRRAPAPSFHDLSTRRVWVVVRRRNRPPSACPRTGQGWSRIGGPAQCRTSRCTRTGRPCPAPATESSHPAHHGRCSPGIALAPLRGESRASKIRTPRMSRISVA